MSEQYSMPLKIYQVFLFLFFVMTGIAVAQDELNLNELRKNAQQLSANPQQLKYQIVDIQDKNGTYTIIYDLNESSEFEYSVSLFLFREKDTKFSIIPKSLAGDIGQGKFTGSGRRIIWDSKKDLKRDLAGNDYYFVLHITKIEPSHFPWTWVGIGGAAAGAAVFLLTRSTNKSGSETSTSEIPAITISRP